MTYQADQETFLAGEFGSAYIQRNQGDALLASNLDFFAKAMRYANGAESLIEFGVNIGMNLKALKLLYPGREMHGIEINSEAAQELGQTSSPENVYNTSILEFDPLQTWDLVLIRGGLIHINPNELPSVY